MMTDEITPPGAEEEETWINMSEASRLTGVKYQTIARLANRDKIPWQKDMYDDRVKLVRLSDVEKIAKRRR